VIFYYLFTYTFNVYLHGMSAYDEAAAHEEVQVRITSCCSPSIEFVINLFRAPIILDNIEH